MVSKSFAYGLFSDEAIFEIIQTLKSKRTFVIETLDKEHVFIDGSEYAWLKSEIDKVLDENIYRNPEQQ